MNEFRVLPVRDSRRKGTSSRCALSAVVLMCTILLGTVLTPAGLVDTHLGGAAVTPKSPGANVVHSNTALAPLPTHATISYQKTLPSQKASVPSSSPSSVAMTARSNSPLPSVSGPMSAVPPVPETQSQSVSKAPGPGSFVAFVNNSLPISPAATRSLVDEPSVANSGHVVFYTGNWYFARSMDGGSSWAYGSPYDDMTPNGFTSDFCCDQDVIYNPSRSIFIWYRQGCVWDQNCLAESVITPTTQSSRFKLGISSDTVSWNFYSIFPENLTSTWKYHMFDFPKLGVSDNYLYITTDLYHATSLVSGEIQSDSVIMRFSLDDLASARPFPFPFNFYYATPTTNVLPTFSFALVQGAHSTMYWATHVASGLVRTYGWAESSTSLSVTDVSVPGFTFTSGMIFDRDNKIRFVNTLGTFFWKPGEPVVYDTNGNGIYDTGDVVIAGSAPPLGTPLELDPLFGYLDLNGNGHWDTGEPVAYDTNDNGSYDYGEPMILGTWGVRASCPTPDLSDICPRFDDRILGGWVSKGVIGFMWNVAQGGAFPYPYTDIVRISEKNMVYIDNPILWSSKYAWVYAWASPNPRGDLGFVAFTAGPNDFPTLNVGVYDDLSPVSPPWEFYKIATSASGPGLQCTVLADFLGRGCWGDYLRVR